MKVYTRTGDAGTTALFGGERVAKNAARVAAYGALDEANAMFGLAVSSPAWPARLKDAAHGIMSDLFDLGAELATPNTDAQDKLGSRLDTAIGAPRIAELEALIDAAEDALSPLKTFVLPTGTEAAARLHVARTVVRRAERDIVALNAAGETVRTEALAYVNRLSDLFFVWARVLNHEAGLGDVPWQARRPLKAD